MRLSQPLTFAPLSPVKCQELSDDRAGRGYDPEYVFMVSANRGFPALVVECLVDMSRPILGGFGLVLQGVNAR